MAKGIIQDNMARPEGDELTPESVRKGMDIPPDQQEAFERVVLAGMKVMFSQETHKLMLKELNGQGPVAQRLGMGVAGLVLLLFKESNNTMPPQILIPAGMELLMQAADFLKKTNTAQVDNKTIGDAMQVMIDTILEKFGASPDKIVSLVDQYETGGIEAAKQQMGV